MPELSGQTDKILKVQLKSLLVTARWGLPEVGLGGSIPVEVMTAYVADGSDIKVTIKDLEGGTIDTLNGKVYANFYRAQYKVVKANKTGGMLFEADLSSHGLKGASGRVKVTPPVKLEKLRWLDDKAAEKMEKIARGTVVTLKADLKEGPPAGSVGISIYCKPSDSRPPILVRHLHEKYEGSKLEFPWLADIEAPGPKLETDLFFEMSLNGFASPPSETMKYLDIDFKFSR
jgi:hypothetical protein